ncbi:MAG: hypothetical protein D3926_08615 [Desulfobacteraceae bacterium]|nr:MAG: hypothetical protein D3926_08615 [Desulfobacteraceae bacterium]
MKCPTCGCERFFVKDADDEYEIYEFTAPGGQVNFDDPGSEDLAEVTSDTETFCDKCAWHGKFSTLK